MYKCTLPPKNINICIRLYQYLAFWRFYSNIQYEVSMKDVRISIRLTEEEHRKFKMIAFKKNKKMQDILSGYIKHMIKSNENK